MDINDGTITEIASSIVGEKGRKLSFGVEFSFGENDKLKKTKQIPDMA